MDSIIHDFILRISPLIIEYGAWGVFFVSLFEETISPVPSSFILLAAGFFLIPIGVSFDHVLLDSVFKIMIPGGLGLTIGLMLTYMLAYFGGEPAILRWGKWIGVSWSDIEKVQKRFTKTFWDELLLFGTRVLPILPHTIISIAFGVIRYPIRPFFTATLLGTMLRALLLGLLGWSLGETYATYSDEFSVVGGWILTGIAVIIVLFITYRILKRRKIL
ncbi:MAG: VTT domain-containing protein [Candidatus Jorgensenbacteria bacterium]|nr:VTT domain-containing protein [Candidatus Jorgensenbacteria bacterium]